MPGDFAARLAFALKALSLSQGRLAAEVAVNKSVVSRWLSGVSEPRGHNLAAITALVAARVEGFSMLDWDLPPAAFEQRLTPATQASGHPLMALPPVIQAASDTAAGSGRFLGLWRMTHPSFRAPDSFAVSHVLMLPGAGCLEVRWISNLFDWPGAAYLVAGRLNLMLGLDDLSYAIFAPPLNPIIETMEGLLLSLVADRDMNIGAAGVYLERVSPPGLTDPADPPLAALIEAAKTAPFRTDPAALEQGLRARLTREIGAAGLPVDGAPILKLDQARSWSRGRNF